MRRKRRFPSLTFSASLLPRTTALALALVFALTMAFTPPAPAQSLTILHSFTGADGALPLAGLAADSAGNLYGTTFTGGNGPCTNDGFSGCGAVFKLTRSGSGWITRPLYSFQGGNDGAGPYSALTIGPDGAIYGTTSSGGGGTCSNNLGYSGCGTVFSLRPPSTACKSALCPWTETVLFRFASANNGALPLAGVTFDGAGNLYGTTSSGGAFNGGVVYELSPASGGWSYNVLYSFLQNNGDGSEPRGGLIFDATGNLWGTARLGGAHHDGTVFELTPSGAGWTESVIHSFTSATDGEQPMAGLIVDNSGNFYGTTFNLGPRVGGTVFELSPSNGGWQFSVLYAFGASGDGNGPAAGVTMDASGNLYGTTFEGGAGGMGRAYRLTPSGGAWREAVLHDFTGVPDGASPVSTLRLDAKGNLYGTASLGGTGCGCGVVFEISSQ